MVTPLAAVVALVAATQLTPELMARITGLPLTEKTMAAPSTGAGHHVQREC